MKRAAQAPSRLVESPQFSLQVKVGTVSLRRPSPSCTVSVSQTRIAGVSTSLSVIASVICVVAGILRRTNFSSTYQMHVTKHINLRHSAFGPPSLPDSSSQRTTTFLIYTAVHTLSSLPQGVGQCGRILWVEYRTVSTSPCEHPCRLVLFVFFLPTAASILF